MSFQFQLMVHRSTQLFRSQAQISLPHLKMGGCWIPPKNINDRAAAKNDNSHCEPMLAVEFFLTLLAMAQLATAVIFLQRLHAYTERLNDM